MARFSPTEAAFEGFRITRERPRVVFVWVLASLAYSFLLGLMALFTLGPEFPQILNAIRSPTMETKDFWRAISLLWPFLIIAAPTFLMFQAVMNCAMYRMILRPHESSRAFLRLGADELRVAGVILVYTAVWTLVLFLTMATALMGGVFGGPVAAFLGSVLTAAAGFYSVLVLVRLSLAAPISFAEQRFTLAASWAITRGQFWRLFGTYVLAFVLGIVTLVLMWVVVALVEVVILTIGGVPLTAVGAPSANPAIFVAGLFSQTALAMMATCYRVIMKSPAAIIVKTLEEQALVNRQA
jgi:hypothetical protein